MGRTGINILETNLKQYINKKAYDVVWIDGLLGRRQSMERFKRILYKILFPGLAVVVIGVPITAALLIYIFAFGHENSPAAYPCYVLDAYFFTILCA